MMRLNSRGAASLLAVVGLALAAAGCGGDSSSSATRMELSLGLPGPTTSSAPFIVAQERGLFEKRGLTVQIEDKGALVPAEVAAGRLDLGQFGTGAAFAPAESGRDMAIVYGLTGNLAGAVQVAANSEFEQLGSTEETLMQLGGKRVAVQGQGGSSYGNAMAISEFVKSRGGKPLELVSLTDFGSMSAQVISGQVDASVVLTNPYVDAIDKGKVVELVPATDKVLQEIEGGDFAAISVFGLASTVEEKREAVTAFVGAVREAYEIMASEEPSQIAETLAQSPVFENLSTENLEAQLALDKPFWNPNDGLITKELWQATLDAIGNWGLPQDLTADTFSFDNIVDMSFSEDS